MKLFVEFDDYPLEVDRTVAYFEELKKSYPGLKVTMFAIPSMMTDDLWKKVDKDWIQVGIHGYRHDKGEMRRVGKLSEQYHIDKLSKIMEDSRWQKIIKPPHYGYSKHVINAAAKLGLALSIRNRGDLFEHFELPCLIPDIKAYVKYEHSDDERWFAHPLNVPSILNPKVQAQFPPKYEACDGNCNFITDALDKGAHKLYLGAGTHVIPGFEHLDHIQHTPDTIKWSWGQPIPFPANSCSYILIQQSLMYCDKAGYEMVLADCRRALMPNGIILIKEDNNLSRVWRNPGYTHGEGTVRSNTNRKELSTILEASRFTVLERDSTELVDDYPDYFNRRRKVFGGHCFIIKALAHKPEVKYEYRHRSAVP
jgi:hypothetical protein